MNFPTHSHSHARPTFLKHVFFFLRSRFICRYANILYVWVSDGWCVCVASLGFYCGEDIIFCSQAERKLLFSSLKIICHRPKRESVLPEYIAYVAAFVPLQFFRSNTPHSSQTLFELSCTRYTSLGTCPQERMLDSSQHWSLQHDRLNLQSNMQPSTGCTGLDEWVVCFTKIKLG